MEQPCITIISEYLHLLEQSHTRWELEAEANGVCGGSEPAVYVIARLSRRPELQTLFAQMEQLAARCATLSGREREITRQRLSAGETVYHVGDAAERLWLVRRGAVKISRPCMGRSEATLELLGVGRCFGWAALRGEPHNFQAEAVGDTELFGLSLAAVCRVLTEQPELALRVLSVMAVHLNETQHWATSLGAYTAAERVAHLLARLAAEFGRPYKEGLERENLQREGVSPKSVGAKSAGQKGMEKGIEIAVRLNQEDLARMVGTTRETVSHSLHKLRADGAVLRPRSPYVVDIGALMSYRES